MAAQEAAVREDREDQWVARAADLEHHRHHRDVAGDAEAIGAVAAVARDA